MTRQLFENRHSYMLVCAGSLAVLLLSVRSPHSLPHVYHNLVSRISDVIWGGLALYILYRTFSLTNILLERVALWFAVLYCFSSLANSVISFLFHIPPPAILRCTYVLGALGLFCVSTIRLYQVVKWTNI